MMRHSVDELNFRRVIAEIEIEGQLKKINPLFNDKDYYRVIGTEMSTARKPNKKFKFAYDLSIYAITLSLKDKCRFELIPLDTSSNSPIVKFETTTVEERARWYKAIKNATRYNLSETMPSDDLMFQKLAENPQGEFDSEDMKTLNGISSLLSGNTRSLQNAQDVSHDSIKTLLTELGIYSTAIGNDKKCSILSQQIKEAARVATDVQKEQRQAFDYLKKVTLDLLRIAEKLAEREAELSQK